MWRAAIVPSLFNITLQSCFAWSPYFINPGLLTFMLRFPQVLFVAAGAYLLFPSERRILRSRIYWLGAIVVLAGSTGICLLGHDLPRGTTALGIALAVSAGLAFGGYSLSIRHFMHDVHPVVAFAVISQYTAAGLVVIMLVVGDQHGFAVMSLTNCQAGLLMASGLVGIAFAHVFYYWSIAKLGVAVSAGVILLQPFVTGATSYFLFGEELTAAQWAAGAVAVVGAGLMLRTQHRLSRS
jgi:drug/metabolite transporter (DMT)-like permease